MPNKIFFILLLFVLYLCVLYVVIISLYSVCSGHISVGSGHFLIYVSSGIFSVFFYNGNFSCSVCNGHFSVCNGHFLIYVSSGIFCVLV